MSNAKSWLPSECIFTLICYLLLQFVSFPKLTHLQLYHGMYFSHPRRHPSCLWSWCFFWPYSTDFSDYFICSISVGDTSKVNEVIGIGTTSHKFITKRGWFVYLPQVANHLPSSKVHLFSPQVFHQNCGRKSTIFGDWVGIQLTDWDYIDIPIDVFESNVPIVQKSMCTEATRRFMIFLWVEASSSMDNIISVIPFLVELLKPKKCLTMSLLPISRSFALVSTASMPIYLNFRKAVALEAWNQYVLHQRIHTTYWSSWIFWYLSWNSSYNYFYLQVYSKSQDASTLSILSVGLHLALYS